MLYSILNSDFPDNRREKEPKLFPTRSNTRFKLQGTVALKAGVYRFRNAFLGSLSCFLCTKWGIGGKRNLA